MKHIRFGESQAAKVEFTFVIESLELVPLKYKNFPMRIEWKRTSDNGKTNKVVPTPQGRVVFNEATTFTSKLYMEKNGLAAKALVFTLVIEDPKNGKSKKVGKASIDLATYCNFEREESVSNIAKTFSKEEKMELKIRLKCKILKLKLKDKKKLAINKKTGQWEEASDSEVSSDWEASKSKVDRTESSDDGSRSERRRSLDGRRGSMDKSRRSRDEDSEDDPFKNTENTRRTRGLEREDEGALSRSGSRSLERRGSDRHLDRRGSDRDLGRSMERHGSQRDLRRSDRGERSSGRQRSPSPESSSSSSSEEAPQRGGGRIPARKQPAGKKKQESSEEEDSDNDSQCKCSLM